MKNSVKIISILISIMTLVSCTNISSSSSNEKDLLPSWNDGNNKNKILNFINMVVSQNIPYEDRIAVFDMDGTIASEKPYCTEVSFSKYHLALQLEKDPSLKSIQPYKALFNNNEKYLTDNVDQVLITPFIGYSTSQYRDSVKSYYSKIKNPANKRKYKDLFYQPMLDLIQLLEENNFAVYYSSYSQQTFMRSVSTSFLDTDEEHAIGSMVELELEIKNDSAFFIRGNRFVDKNVDKAEVFEYQTGKRPIFVAGNSSGDLQIFNYVNKSKLHMVMLVNHNDSVREFYYLDDTMLSLGVQNQWSIINMQSDFKNVFIQK